MKNTISILLLMAMVACAATPLIFTDPRDKHKYKIIQVETQVWMAENLAYAADGSVCYNNQKQDCTKHGRYYNFEAAETACPAGWHLPSQQEFNLLRTNAGRMVAGQNLKDTTSWKFLCDEDMSLSIACPMDETISLTDITDNYGFSAKATGYCKQSEALECSELSKVARFWSSTVESDSLHYYQLHITNSLFKYRATTKDNNDMFSVRCIKD